MAEINAMSFEEIETRTAEIAEEMNAEGANIDALLSEVEQMQERKNELKENAEKRASLEKIVNAGEGVTVVEEIKEERKEEEKMEKRYGTESKEYRDAFYANLAGVATEEQRTILATPLSVDGDASNDGTALVIPKTLDTKIWDNVHTAHPILEDITIINSGIVMEVTKHTAIATRVQGKKDGATGAGAEENTWVKVTLAGVDYEKYVELTYAQAKMSQGALEDYLAEEISAELGEALAKDVFAKMVSDAGTGRKVTKGTSWFNDIATALGKADHADNATIYASVADYYDILGAVDSNGQPIFRNGLILEANLKKDNAVPTGKVVIVDAKKFVLNQVQGILIESDRDVKAHRVVVSGYLRAEGCLRDNGACAYIE